MPDSLFLRLDGVEVEVDESEGEKTFKTLTLHLKIIEILKWVPLFLQMSLILELF